VFLPTWVAALVAVVFVAGGLAWVAYLTRGSGL